MSELFDVLDENGVKTGEILPKQEVFDHGLWHLAVHVWIHTADMAKLLLQLRNPDHPLFGGLWDASVGGHVSSGDTAYETAVRETQEELGVEITIGNLLFTGREKLEENVPGWEVPHREHIDVMLCELPEDTEFKLQPEEVYAIRWWSLDELDEALYSSSEIFLPRLKYWHRVVDSLRQQGKSSEPNGKN